MDASRFKRRSTTQTQRQTTYQTASRQRPATVSRTANWTPAPVAPAPVLIPVTVAPEPAFEAVQYDAPVADSYAYEQPEVAAEPAPAAATRPLLDMELPGALSPGRQLLLKLKGKRARTARRWALRATVAVMVLFIAGGGLLFSQGFLKLHKVFKGGTATVAALKPNVAPALLKGEGAGRVNVLLLGRGGGTHDGPDLTDSMMVASIDPVNHKATLVSIPRDLWVQIANGGNQKINAAWETGEFNYEGKIAPGSTDSKAIQAGFDDVDQAVQNVLGIDINYNMIVDFQAFQQAINTVGGVTVNVPTDLVDPTMAWQNGNNPILAAAGTDTFDGAHALNYVRSRETTSDFARGQRQRSVLLALKDKTETLGVLSNPVKLSGLISAFGNNVASDISLSDASRFANILKDIPSTSINSIGLTDTADGAAGYVTTGNIDGQSVVLPKAGLFDYADIQNYVHTQLKDGFLTKENAKIEVLNGTTVSGLAATTAATLTTYGYDVTSTGNAPGANPTTQVIDLSGGKNPYTLNYLQQRFKVTGTTTLPATVQANGADFVIIVGNDYTSSSSQN